MSEELLKITANTHTIVKDLYDEFQEHRKESQIAMGQINNMEHLLNRIAPTFENLKALPSIDNNLSALKVGLVDQNKTLIGQNGQLIQPVTRTSNILMNIVVISILAVLIIALIILVRDSSKNLELNKDGLKVSEPVKK